MNDQFWKGKTVFVTGHTGFKGGWLVIWLHRMGARVVGYSLAPQVTPNLYSLARIGELCVQEHIADIRDLTTLTKAMQEANPDIVMHLAAQPLVRQSYIDPVETYSTNVMGTVHVLEAVRATPSVRSCLVVTTDKCYENKEWNYGYRETDTLGGHDPYSNSKACAELVVSAYRRSFFTEGVSLSSVRAGNVIGGGDWSEDRLVPDAMKAFTQEKPFVVRNPQSIRPWQHVLEPLAGYLELVERQWNEPMQYSEAFNFGPYPHQVVSVGEVADLLVEGWGADARWEQQVSDVPASHEAGRLMLDISHTCARLAWAPKLTVSQAIARTVDWYKKNSEQPDSARQLCQNDITFYNTIL